MAVLAGGSGYPAPMPAAPDKIYGAGTAVVRIGGSYIDPMSDRITLANGFTDLANSTVDPIYGDAFRATVNPKSEWGWNITGMWMPIDHWGLELSYTRGSEHRGLRHGHRERIAPFDVSGVRIGRFEPEISAATVNWYPLDPTCQFQPYIGVGINYSDYRKQRFTLFNHLSPEDQAIVDELGLDGRFNVGYSWGHTWQIGADWVFGRDSNWLVNAAAIYTDSETEIGFNVTADPDGTGDTRILDYSGDYRYDPWTFNIGVGYKFNL